MSNKTEILSNQETQSSNESALQRIDILLFEYFQGKKGSSIKAYEESEKIKQQLKTHESTVGEIQSYSISEDTLQLKNTQGEIYVFNLKNPDSAFIGEKEKLTSLEAGYDNLLDSAQDTIALMDIIFAKNSKEWFKELDEKDALSQKDIDEYIQYGYKVEGLKKYNAQEVDMRLLQKEFLLLYGDLQKVPRQKLSAPQKQRLTDIEEKYLERSMGIGNLFEGSVSFLSHNRNDTELMIQNIVGEKSIHQCLNYFDWIVRQMYENKRKSTSVMQVYAELFLHLKRRVFERMKQEGATPEESLRFIKMLRGVGIYEIDSELREVGMNWGKIFSREIVNMEESKVKHDFVDEVLAWAMNQKGGMVEKILQKGSFGLEDSLIEHESPEKLMKGITGKLQKKGNGFYAIIFDDNLPYKNLLGTTASTYNELSYQQKSTLSILYRLSQKLDGVNTPEELRDTTKEISDTFYNQSCEKLESMVDGGWNPFTGDFWNGKAGSLYGFTETENQIFEQFKQVHGIGALEGSDLADEWRNGGIAFATTLGVAILAPEAFVPYASTATKVMIGGGAASVKTILDSGKGYDTPLEAGVDISTDIATGMAFGWASGKYLGEGVNNQFTKMLQKYVPNEKARAAAIITADVGALGLAPETGRTMLIDKAFHSKPIFEEDAKDKTDKTP